MKRTTQILASILFVITVVTVYFAFDFAINSAVSNKNSVHKHSHHDHDHDHNHPPDDIKITKRRSPSNSKLSYTKKSNRTIKHQNDDEHDVSDNDRHTRSVKRQQQTLRAKPGSFHKAKTGVSLNKPRKSVKDRRKRLPTTTLLSHRKDKDHLNDK